MTGYVGPIEKTALNNGYFRQVLFTGKHSQLVVMCLQPSEEIGDEVHPNVDQFFRIEEGGARFVFNSEEEHLVRAGGHLPQRDQYIFNPTAQAIHDLHLSAARGWDSA